MPPAKPPTGYAGVEAGAGLMGGFTTVGCCDENEDYRIFYFWKICRSVGGGVSIGMGHVTNFSGSKCRLERYEGPFIEFGAGEGVNANFDLGTNWDGTPTGVNDVGVSLGLGTPAKFAICFYKAIGRGTIIRGGCKCDRVGEDGLALPLPNTNNNSKTYYTMDDFLSGTSKNK